jgi:hypothetical protein
MRSRVDVRLAAAAVAAALLFLGACDDPTEAEEPGVELLVNGDVELGTGGIGVGAPYSWLVGRSGSAGVSALLNEWTAEAAAKGVRSLKILPNSSAPAGTAPWTFWFQSSGALADPTAFKYVLSASIKLVNVSGAPGAILALRGDSLAAFNGAAEAFASTDAHQVLTGTRDWTRVSVELSSLPPYIVQLTALLMLAPSSTGSVYFDDVTLTAVPKKP